MSYNKTIFSRLLKLSLKIGKTVGMQQKRLSPAHVYEIIVAAEPNRTYTILKPNIFYNIFEDFSSKFYLFYTQKLNGQELQI